MPNPNELERERLASLNPRTFEVSRPCYRDNADGTRTRLLPYMETLTITARDWDDAEVQAKGMGDDALVVAEVVRDRDDEHVHS